MCSTLAAAQPYSAITILLKSLDKGQLQLQTMSKMLAHAESVALKVFTQLYAYGEISTKEPQIMSNLNQSQQSFNWKLKYWDYC